MIDLKQRRRQFAKVRSARLADLIARDGDVCHYCGYGFDDTNFVYQVTVDHIVPISEGGSDDLTNLVLACRQCNGKKKDRSGFVPFSKLRGLNQR